MMKSKKLKVIVGICFLVVVIYGIFYVITNWNVKKIAFDDVKNIHINYYANNQSNIPAITVELGQDDKEEFLKGLAKCKFMKRKNPEECRWDGENYKFEEDCDYEVVLDNNTKLKFVYMKSLMICIMPKNLQQHYIEKEKNLMAYATQTLLL